MDALTFISKVLEALAWPMSAVAIVIILRKEISRLVPFLKKLKAGPVEAEFEKGVSELPAISETIDVSEENVIEFSPSKELLLEISQINPRSAIMEAWMRIEAAGNLAIHRNQQKLHGPGAMSTRVGGRALGEALKRNGIFSEKQNELYIELMKLRNNAAHSLDFNPPQESVIHYIDIASHLQWWLEESVK